MHSMLLAAAAALATPLPVAAAATAPTTVVREAGEHIRTTLHGTRGPVVVLIPGMSTPAEVWDETVAALRPDHRLLVVEVRGFDGKDAPANRSAGLIDGIVAELSADLKARGIERAAIVGHSFGGLVAMQFALAHPSKAERLLVVDALPFFGTVFDPKATVESVRPRAARMRDMMVAQAAAIRAAAAKGVTSDPGGDMSARAGHRIRIANWSMRSDPAVVAQALYEDLGLDLRAAIARIEAPMTVLYQAARQPEIAHERYRADYSARPATRLVPVADTGHFIMLDRPDAVLAEVKALLARD